MARTSDAATPDHPFSPRVRRPRRLAVGITAILLATAALSPAIRAQEATVPPQQDEAAGQTAEPAAQSEPAAPPAKPCTAPEYRQFDFWLGDWEVTTPAGEVAGHNRIESILGGCVLRESWTGAKGSRGHSHNIYDRTRGRWHQTWVDDGGLLLVIEGGLEEGSMVLRGDTVGRDGKPRSHQIRWTPLDGGKVRQHWQVSADGGTAWQTVFEGIYAKRP